MKLREIWFNEILFPLFPYVASVESRRIKTHIEKIFQSRWDYVKKKFELKEDETMPKLRIRWQIPRSYVGYYTSKGRMIIILAGIIYRTDIEIYRTVDHEFVHYIQYLRNKELSRKRNMLYGFTSLFDQIYWRLTKKGVRSVALSCFKEGYATFVASRTSKAPLGNGRIKAIEEVFNNEISISSGLFEYAIGYLAYLAIAKTSSEKEAISLGLTANLSQWINVTRKAFHELKIPSPI